MLFSIVCVCNEELRGAKIGHRNSDQSMARP